MKQKALRLICLFATGFYLLLMLSACTSNTYKDFYSACTDIEYIKSEEITPVMFEEIDGSILKQLQENDDYIIIGISSFYSLWVPRTFAIDCAKEYGASIIVFSYQAGETKDSNITINVPTSNTTYHHGTVYSPYGGYANFSGTSTTYESQPVTINYSNIYYHQYAYFLAKRKYINSFGLYFRLPENVLGNTDSKIRIALVKPNSPAAKLGIKPGDIVEPISKVLALSC